MRAWIWATGNIVLLAAAALGGFYLGSSGRSDGKLIEIAAYFNEPGQVFDDNRTQAC